MAQAEGPPIAAPSTARALDLLSGTTGACLTGKTATGTVATTAARRALSETQPAQRGASSSCRRQQRREDRGEPAKWPASPNDQANPRGSRRNPLAQGPPHRNRPAYERSKADGSTDLLNWDVRPRRFNSHQHARRSSAETPRKSRAGRDPGKRH